MDPNDGIECVHDGYTPTTINILNHQPGSTEVFCSFTPASCRLEPEQKYQVLLKDPYPLDILGHPISPLVTPLLPNHQLNLDDNLGLAFQENSGCRLNPIISHPFYPTSHRIVG